jgi:hypothetical protein
MAWLAADSEGEFLFINKPIRNDKYDCWEIVPNEGKSTSECYVQLKEGEIKRLLHHKMTYKSNPVEIEFGK